MTRDELIREYGVGGRNFSGADLRDVDLSGANLSGANLSGANLSGADLRGCEVPSYGVVPEEGSFIGWKKRADGALVKLRIPSDSARVTALGSRKCRCEFAEVLEVIGGDETTTCGPNYGGVEYIAGATVVADTYCDDPRDECTNGIHFFITRREAEEW